MGIFNKLFKQSPEKLKAKENARRAQYLIVNQEWEHLVEIGEPAVNPLISCLKDNDEDIVVNVAWTLGKIGDVKAIEQLGVCIISAEAALRDQMDWDRYETLVPVVAGRLSSI